MAKVVQKTLSNDAKEDLALALILLRDFKGGGMDIKTVQYILGLAEAINVKEEYDKLMPKIPPMIIKPRDQ